MLWRMWEIGIIGINYQNYCGFIPKENCFIFIVTTDEKRVIEMSMDPAIGARIRRERNIIQGKTWQSMQEYLRSFCMRLKMARRGCQPQVF